MTSHRQASRRAAAAAPRLGLFGLLGQGNLGNDGSLEAVLGYLRATHPDVILDALCSGPELVTARYGIPAARLRWYQPERQRASGPAALPLKCLRLGLGTAIDTIRTAAWVRRHDVVVVPGMGVLEATVPMRPWQTPYSMFLLCASGRLFGTKVALVSVGTNIIHQRLTRWLITTAARLAYYRSYRDTVSRDAMRQMGLDTSGDAVYPDVVFALPVPHGEQGATGTVGVGVMDYSGANEDRPQADEIRSGYIEKMTRFVLWLIENDRPVRLFTSDTADEPIVQQILAGVRAQYPGLGPARLIAEPVTSLAELLRQTASVDTAVATRYHNVLYALKMAKPTLSLGYAMKHEILMAQMGMSRFSQSAKSMDVTQLIGQFTELEDQAAQLRLALAECNAVNAQLVGNQFAELSTALFPAGQTTHTASGHDSVRSGAS
jgi:polysaccharide pyruvyl transferase WcaK-like protein